MSYDVAIIGAGVVGCAIARELSRYELAVVLIEAQNDVGKGTSKANTAILHTGFDAKPNTLESRLLQRGYERLKVYGEQVGIPIEPLGALLVAWNDAQLEALPELREKALANGVIDVEIISADEVYQREPRLGSGAVGGLFVPGESTICPFTTPLAYATEAVANGLELRLNSPLQAIQSSADFHSIECPDETIHARWVINAAGLSSDVINGMFGHSEFTVTPRRGELIVYDKFSRGLVNHILLPVPTKVTKGVLISPTVFGNVMLGPTAENLEDKSATETTADGIRALLEQGQRILPELMNEEVTATYAGLRAATEFSDYQIHIHAERRYICVGGIRSTGLSASMGIAEYVQDQLGASGLELRAKPETVSIHMPNIGEAFVRPYQSGKLIASDARYGRVVCFCERVTQGEIQDALHSTIPAQDIDGLRRRTRAQMGRCQGFFCSAEIAALLQRTNRHETG